jgi:hypothetical protein
MQMHRVAPHALAVAAPQQPGSRAHLHCAGDRHRILTAATQLVLPISKIYR